MACINAEKTGVQTGWQWVRLMLTEGGGSLHRTASGPPRMAQPALLGTFRPLSEGREYRHTQQAAWAKTRGV